VEYNEAQEGY
jgi:hypothetical protein